MRQLPLVITLTLCVIQCLFPRVAHASPTGWDYNLTKKCIKSVDSQDSNYYQDLSECNGVGNWTIAIQSESALGHSCIGNNNQSFPINTPTSPLTLNWKPTQKSHPYDSPWTIELTTDLLTKTHPCPGGNFNWYAVMDHVGHGGGPFSKPNDIATSAKLTLSSELTNEAALRSFTAFQGFWNGMSYGIEINHYLSPNWGDAHSDPAVIQVAQTDTYQFFSLDGRYFNVSQNLEEEKTIYIKWIDILNYLSANGLISLPTDWNSSATGAVYIGTELNNFKPTESGKSTLLISNFRNAKTIDSIPGDLNSDGSVNLLDFNLLISKFGNPYTILDFNALIRNFGK